MLDAPNGEAADRPEDQQQGKPGRIGQSAAEIDDDAEQAAGDGGCDADPRAADRGRKEYCREVRCEEDIGAHLRQSPPCGGRQRQAKERKADAEKQRGLGNSLPAVPELVHQFRHCCCHFT